MMCRILHIPSGQLVKSLHLAYDLESHKRVISHVVLSNEDSVLELLDIYLEAFNPERYSSYCSLYPFIQCSKEEFEIIEIAQ